MSRVTRNVVLLGLAVLLLAGASGCSSPRDKGLKSVSDPAGLFHFKVPEQWQAKAEATAITVYAAKTLPAKGEKADALSVLVLSSSDASDAPAPEVLEYLIDARAHVRGWQDVRTSTVQNAKLGGRDAHMMEVTAKNAEGGEFSSRYYFARTNGREVFLAAIAPDGKEIATYDDEVRGITEKWYWHVGRDKVLGSGESTPVAQ